MSGPATGTRRRSRTRVRLLVKSADGTVRRTVMRSRWNACAALAAGACLCACNPLLDLGNPSFERAPSTGVRYWKRIPGFADGGVFGASIAIANDTIAISAPFEASADGTRTQVGAVYLYDLNGTATERREMPNADTDDGVLPPDLILPGIERPPFNWPAVNVALSQTTLVVAVPAEASGDRLNPVDNSAPYAGAVFVYDRSSPQAPPQYIKSPHIAERDVFGFSIALSEHWLAIAAPRQADPYGVASAGAVYTYHRDQDRGPFDPGPDYLQSPRVSENAAFGTSVALSEGPLSGDLLLVGAANDPNGGSGIDGDANPAPANPAPRLGNGAVYVFDRQGSIWNWSHTIQPTYAQENAYFGTSVALSPQGFVVGAPGAAGCSRPTSPTKLGAAYSIRQVRGGLVEDCVEPIGERAFFGGSVAMLGSRFVVGAPLDTGAVEEPTHPVAGAGVSYFFDVAGSALHGKRLRAPDPKWAAFGFSLATSARYLAVSAAYEFVPARPEDAGVPKPDEQPRGAVYIYERDDAQDE